jgi:ankyrin repeat protein
MSDAMQALYEGDAERAKSLLPPDDELDVFHAAAFGRTERLRELLADPAQANAFSDDGFTPLHLAVYAEQADAARALIEAGADVNAVSKGPIAQVPPLGTAAFVRSQAMTQLLLDAGADPGGLPL